MLASIVLRASPHVTMTIRGSACAGHTRAGTTAGLSTVVQMPRCHTLCFTTTRQGLRKDLLRLQSLIASLIQVQSFTKVPNRRQAKLQRASSACNQDLKLKCECATHPFFQSVAWLHLLASENSLTKVRSECTSPFVRTGNGCSRMRGHC